MDYFKPLTLEEEFGKKKEKKGKKNRWSGRREQKEAVKSSRASAQAVQRMEIINF